MASDGKPYTYQEYEAHYGEEYAWDYWYASWPYKAQTAAAWEHDTPHHVAPKKKRNGRTLFPFVILTAIAVALLRRTPIAIATAIAVALCAEAVREQAA